MPPLPLPVIAGAYYGRIAGTFESLPMSITFGFKVTPAPSAGTADAAVANSVAVALATRWPVFAAAELPTTYTGADVTVYPLGSPLLPAAVSVAVAPGGVAGIMAPTATAILISQKVVRRGRGSQSRTFLSPVITAAISGDGKTITPGTVAAVQASWDSFVGLVLADLNTAYPGAWERGQVSKHLATFFPIIGDVVEPALSTQRRRTRR